MGPRQLLRYEQIRRRGRLDVPESDAPYSEGRYFEAKCSAIDEVNDAVHVVAEVGGYSSVTHVDPKIVATMPAVGVIVQKSTSTDCIVQVTGRVTTLSGLVPGLFYFVGEDSKPTSTPPVNAVKQIIGVSIGVTRLLLTPNFLPDMSLFGGEEKNSVALLGIKNGINRVFTTPEPFVHANDVSIRVYHNGRRLHGSDDSSPVNGDYFVSESGGIGSGYDTVTFLSLIPVAGSGLFADYKIA